MPLTRLPARRLAVTNITDNKGIITPQSLAQGIQHTASVLTQERIPTPRASFLRKLPVLHKLANRFPPQPLRSVLLCDPTTDWNYFERRVDEEESARLLLQALLPNLKDFRTIKILVATPETALAYETALQNLKTPQASPQTPSTVPASP
jgi:hypothetical protein